VHDPGIGIAPEERERIFNQFYRGAGMDAVGGMGLGLALCRKITELHRGRIWVDSTPGAGSNFHVTLPLLVDETAPAEASV